MSQSLTNTPTAHIRLDEQGRAWIDDTNVKVIEVVLETIACQMSPQEIHTEHPGLSLAQIHAALSYYYDHKTEFDAKIDQDRQYVEELMAEADKSPQRQRLKKLKEQQS